MIRWVLIGFLVAHGLVHIAVWAPARTAQGTIPSHSWLLGNQRALVVGLMIAAIALFSAAGVGLLFHAGWWGPMTVVAAGVSLLLVVLFPGAILNAWLIAPVAINVGLIMGVVWFAWPSRAAFGG
jgi:hypothetical protein